MRQMLDERKFFPAMLLLVLGLACLALAISITGPVLLSEKAILLLVVGLGSMAGGVSLFIRSANKA